MKTRIHLVRHGEVENPHNIWYGRMEGFVLSDRGRRQAGALGEFFAGEQIDALYASPLSRALQTAGFISKAVGLETVPYEGIIECSTKLEGKPGDFRMFKNPLNLRHFVAPGRPSWGEPYREIRKRMVSAIEDIRARHAGGQIIAVSHLTPVLVARLWAEGNPRPPWRAKLACTPASVTTLEFDDDGFVGTRYTDLCSLVS